LGWLARDSGQSRVPVPPQRITGVISGPPPGWVVSEPGLSLSMGSCLSPTRPGRCPGAIARPRPGEG
jgi:hypothetical protein